LENIAVQFFSSVSGPRSYNWKSRLRPRKNLRANVTS